MKDASDVASKFTKPDLIATVYGTELIIDKPVHEVWRHIFDYADWNPEHFGARFARVAGREDEEGEVLLEAQKSGDGYAPPRVIETINLIQNERLVWALYMPDSGLSDGIAFVEFTLKAVGGKTLFICRGYAAYPSGVVGTTDKAAVQQSFSERIKKIIPELKAYVERH